jgi:hypothetical protein
VISEEPGRRPADEEVAAFWALIEAAWEPLGDKPAALRRALRERDPAANENVYEIEGWLNSFLDSLLAWSADLAAEELVALDRVAERKLYDIDREDIHAVTDGSDDSFLYARGFDDFPETGSGISRESFGNPAGWSS